MTMPLEHPDVLHLLAAHGWLELGNHAEANEELENIRPEYRVHPDVLEVRWQIYTKYEKWEGALDIASTLMKIAPERAESWIHRSFSLHVLNRTQEAFDLLLPASEQFPQIWTIPYNLACYTAQLGRLDDAATWFKKAMAIEETAAGESALDDPDLRPLWDSMSGTFWKRSD
jgi:tetratricopeptide (TPR) repeat protein